jgi:hypothetical protein
MQVVPGLSCDKHTFSALVRLYTGDDQLADRVRDANLTPWTLCQAAPFVDGDGAQLLLAHKPLLCTVAGVPARTHWTAPAPADETADALPPPALRPATHLRSKRLRVSLRSQTPHFQRIDATRIACNGCATAIHVPTDAALVQHVFMPAWHELHWKTFLCERCQARARLVDSASMDVCRNCYGASPAATARTALCYARSDDPTRPRDIVLCSSCTAKPVVRAQLATVRLPVNSAI